MNNVKIEPFEVIGISVRTTNENGQAKKDIADLWGKFMAEQVLDAIPNKIDNTVYAIYTDYESDHTKPYTTILGCKVANLNTIPNGMIGKSFDGGNYVKLTARGDLMKGLIGDKWAEIWKTDLNRVFTADFEVFGEKSQNPTDAEIDFLIGYFGVTMPVISVKPCHFKRSCNYIKKLSLFLFQYSFSQRFAFEVNPV